MLYTLSAKFVAMCSYDTLYLTGSQAGCSKDKCQTVDSISVSLRHREADSLYVYDSVEVIKLKHMSFDNNTKQPRSWGRYPLVEHSQVQPVYWRSEIPDLARFERPLLPYAYGR